MRRWIRRMTAPWSARIAVLAYHRVHRRRTDPHALCVRPERFEAHLVHLKRTLPVLRLEDLAESLHGGAPLPRRAAVLTFDDGYADNLHEAEPILRRQDVPAVVFVSTGQLDSPTGFWWDELERLLPPSEYRQAHAALKALSPAEREAGLERIRRGSPDAPPPDPEDRPLTRDEARALADGGLVDLGAHARTHSILSGLPEAAQREEILSSKRLLEGLTGRPVRAFAYPFGGTRDFGPRTASLVREAGFRCACSTEPEPVTRRADPFALPRLTVRDWETAEFAGRLDRFLGS